MAVTITEYRRKNKRLGIRLVYRSHGEAEWKSKYLIGKFSKKDMTRIAAIAAELDACLHSGGTPPPHLQLRVEELSGEIKSKFVQIGLLPEEAGEEDFTLGNWLLSCLDHQTRREEAGDITDGTLRHHKNTVGHLVRYFGFEFSRTKKGSSKKSTDFLVQDVSRKHIASCGTDIREITEETIEEYILFRKTHDEASQEYIKKEKGRISGYFKKACKRKLITINPVADITISVDATEKGRNRVVVPAEKLDRIESWYEQQEVKYEAENKPKRLRLRFHGYRIFFLLHRYIGNRKNEILQLRWSDIKTEERVQKIQLRQPKTEKKSGKYREMPIYAELIPILKAEAAYQEKVDGVSPWGSDTFVVRWILNLHDNNRSKVIWRNVNPSTDLAKHIKKAGVERWAKLSQNLRVTREHELLRQGKYSQAAIHAFIGHDPATYESWYKTMTEDDFLPLSGPVTKLSQNESRERGMKAPNKKDQNLENLVSLAKPLISEEGWEKGVIPLGLEPRTT
ncbi:MAG: tyrosine-type recombinase/integrase [Pirellulaceae bacterium]|nr:tyrosine-type recombinase/integrase [Pirellulaceae bacterium]